MNDHQRERLLKADAQKRKPLEGLMEDELLKELDEALSSERQGAVLRKIEHVGSLRAADRLDELAGRFRAGDMAQEWQQPRNAFGLEHTAEEIRFRHTGDRKHRVRAWMIMTNPADGRSIPRLDEIVRQGIVEVRGNLVGLADRGSDESRKEETRRAIMLLDLWEQAKTPEETFVRAVEQDQYLPLKACGVDYLLELDQVSDSTRRRVREALLPRVEAALQRAKTSKSGRLLVFRADGEAPLSPAETPVTVPTPGTSCQGGSQATEEDYASMCALYGFWLKHSKEESRAAQAAKFFCFAPCGTHYSEGWRVSPDGRCP